MQHRWSSVSVSLLVFVLSAACASNTGGGDDDDDITIDQGDGDADGDGDVDGDVDGDADGDVPEAGCGDACTNVVAICEGQDRARCVDACGLYAEFSEDACLGAYETYNACIAEATTCDPQRGPQGCDRQAQTVNTECANGCVDIMVCFEECGDDQECGSGCVDNGEPEGVAILRAMLTCIVGECGDPPASAEGPEADAWNECAAGACPEEQVQCR